ncbi:MAG: aminotransferase class III-fold pyridoxal phosphate-dependent enzyme, partial [Clostridia bacterium]|nr:aminotransferase class III-fold pyridoxal phosphate-dependent enzyme [Clostridia bacterium]
MLDAATLPQVRTPLPGPKSQELWALREKYVTRGAGNTTHIFIEEARGAMLRDVDGNTLLDFAGGIGVLNVGHCPEQVVRAVKEQAEKYLHLCFHVALYEPYVRLAEKLVNITPGSFSKKVMFVNSGAEAVENAVKFARKYTERSGIVALECAFHGRTLMAMSLTSKVKPYKFGFGPFAPEVYKVHSPYCYRCLFNATYPGCGLHCLEYVQRFLAAEAAAEKIAAVVVEVVQGEGGFIVCPKEFLLGLKELCKQYGIVYIVDEVQTGFGRTGKMFASEHY